MTKTTRDQGFYWISRKGRDAEIARWDGNDWWLVGDECERDDDDIECLSERIQEPQELPNPRRCRK